MLSIQVWCMLSIQVSLALTISITPDLLVPDSSWKFISLDFIIELPSSKGFDEILIVDD